MPEIQELETKVWNNKDQKEVPTKKPHPGHFELDPKKLLGAIFRDLHMMAYLMPKEYFKKKKHRTGVESSEDDEELYVADEEKIQEVKEFLRIFHAWLMCYKCKVHYKKWILANPPRMDDLFHWTVDLHNAVNRDNGKPTFTYDQARHHTQMALATNTEEIAELKERFAKMGVTEFPLEQDMKTAYAEIARLEANPPSNIQTSLEGDGDLVSEAESSQASAALVVVLVIAAGLLGLGGFLYFKKKRSANLKQEKVEWDLEEESV